MSNSNHQRNTSANKMLIDATHPEETRVVVLRHGRVEEFDYESAARKLLRGNIYLAKVTRVEPSLQAAFVDYGGNRHGFLAFNEIHPDYYQIPIADRRALIEAEAQAEAEEEAEVERAAQAASRRRRRPGPARSAPGASGAAPRDGDEDSAVDVTHLLPPEGPAEGQPEGLTGHSGEQSGQPAAGHDVGHHVADDHSRVISESTGTADARYAEPLPRNHDASPDAAATDHRYTPTEQLDGDHTQHVHGHDHGHHDHAHPEAGRHEQSHEHAADHAHHDARARDERPSVSERSEGQVEEINGNNDVETLDNGNGSEADQVETVASESEDALEELQSRPRRRLRSYKIQEVIKRRQVILVQVVKEERGTKGAALTSYLSLAGRYTVLMPNTARGGGISRKITNAQDRKRLKAIADELEVEEGMGLIIRTAGAARTKQEIKRDYEYLMRLWESVRDVTLASVAPTLVYEEGNLIKRSIRDLYGKEVEEVVVAGDVAHAEAQDFMRMLMPAHAKNVLRYQDAEPLFSRYQIEKQLNAMFSPYVHLRSGGYLVINQTEALVSVDVNSGKSTREFSIEETAYATNLEAADEIARQLKLRDLAGLIVIDFIDMEEKRNNRAVERRLKDALRFDRARIQVGHISHFGLLEMSRQRLRTGVLEGSTTQCPHCQGTGIIRSTESVALAVLRGLEDALMSGPPASIIASTTATVALYILNNKRAFISEMESRYGITIQITSSDKMQGANFGIERLAVRREDAVRRPERAAVSMDWGFEGEGEAEVAAPGQAAASQAAASHGATSHGAASRGSTRDAPIDDPIDDDASEAGDEQAEGEAGGDRPRRRRRRGRGRRDDQPMPQQSRSHGEARGEPRGERPERSARDDEPAPRQSGDQPRRGHSNGNGHAAHVDVSGDHVADTESPAVIAAVDLDSDSPREQHPRQDREAGEGGGRRGRRRGRRGGRRGGQERGNDADQPNLSTGATASAVGTDIGLEHADDRGSDRRIDEPVREPAVFEPAAAQVAGQHPHEHQPHEQHAYEPPQRDVAPVYSERDHVEVPYVAPPVAMAHAADAAEPAPEPAPQPAPSPRRSPVSSEPVLERVVVGPHAAATTAEEPRPFRRGWWQRK